MDTAGPYAAAAPTSALQMSCATRQSEGDGAGEYDTEIDELTTEERAELQAQLQVEAICEVLQTLPKRDLWELIWLLGMPVPSPDSGERVSKMSLVYAALAYLHEQMHRGVDMEDYEITIYSHVRELVDMGFMADPWIAVVPAGEELTAMHTFNELASYLPVLSEVDLRTALDGLSCDCLLDAKTRTMSVDQLADSIIGHLQHVTNERGDFSVEKDVLRTVYSNRMEDEDSDSEYDTSQSVAILPSELTSTSAADQSQATAVAEEREMTKSEMVERIDQVAGKLSKLPRCAIAGIIDCVCPPWLTAEMSMGYDSRDAVKSVVVLEIRDALRAKALFSSPTSASDAAEALRAIAWAIAAFPRIERQRFLGRTLSDRGRRARRPRCGKMRARRCSSLAMTVEIEGQSCDRSGEEMNGDSSSLARDQPEEDP